MGTGTETVGELLARLERERIAKLREAQAAVAAQIARTTAYLAGRFPSFSY